MAASVLTVNEGQNKFIYNVRGTGADETNTVIIDISTKAGPLNGVAPTKLKLEEIWWTIHNYDYVQLSFDRGTDVIVDYFQGQGYMDFRPYGGKIDNGSGGTGDLLLTSSGATSGSNYSFIIVGKFKQ